MAFTVLAILSTVTAVAGSITFKDCGSTGATIQSVNVNGCTAEPCHLIRGTNASLQVNFTATEDMSHPTNAIFGVIAGVQVKFPGHEDCCSNNNLVCPIKSGTVSQYKNTIFVAKSYPTISLLVKLSVLDDSKKDFLCIIFPAIVTDS
ncbi:ecdysteroid-regulated 16 kDa protein-like [Argopecten irradians]|uniref:ecdysteroid-regulated 16 kDa protein-like n=1 Tax=Argopecten irradians TaxID=31199 RepID=UPI003720A36B